jgi:hypothetical protein
MTLLVGTVLSDVSYKNMCCSDGINAPTADDAHRPDSLSDNEHASEPVSELGSKRYAIWQKVTSNSQHIK